jgi:hypothetical protein
MKINNPYAEGDQIFYHFDFSNVQSKSDTIKILQGIASTVEKISKAKKLDPTVAQKVSEASNELQKSGNSQVVVKRLAEAQTLLSSIKTATDLVSALTMASDLVRKFF